MPRMMLQGAYFSIMFLLCIGIEQRVKLVGHYSQECTTMPPAVFSLGSLRIAGHYPFQSESISATMLLCSSLICIHKSLELSTPASCDG